MERAARVGNIHGIAYFTNMETLRTGSLLIAEPFLKDPNFSRTVVLICEYQPEGSVGFILSRPLESTLAELLPDVTQLPVPVYYGGPVQPDTLHFLHRKPELITGGMPLVNNIYWGGDFTKAIQLLQEEILTSSDIRFFLGYSGWSARQLDTELDEHSWLVSPSTTELIFHPAPTQTWKDALLHMGGEYRQLIHYPSDPQLN